MSSNAPQFVQNPTFSSWAIAWLIVIATLWGLNKTRWGHTILYLMLWGMIIYIAIVHYQDIAQTFINAGLLAENNSPNAVTL